MLTYSHADWSQLVPAGRGGQHCRHQSLHSLQQCHSWQAEGTQFANLARSGVATATSFWFLYTWLLPQAAISNKRKSHKHWAEPQYCQICCICKIGVSLCKHSKKPDCCAGAGSDHRQVVQSDYGRSGWSHLFLAGPDGGPTCEGAAACLLHPAPQWWPSAINKYSYKCTWWSNFLFTWAVSTFSHL